jgi:virginiamycin B lyase
MVFPHVGGTGGRMTMGGSVSGRRLAVGSRHRQLRRVVVAVLLLVGSPVLSLGLTAVPASAAGPVTTFTGAGIQGPQSIAAGNDGTMWFTNLAGGPNGSGSIGRITRTGVVTTYGDPSVNGPGGIARGSDGAFWFTNANNGIGRITTAGKISVFFDPSISAPHAIAAGPDGALWFTNSGNHSVGRITTAGKISHFSDPRIDPDAGIVAGPDGALWFTNLYANSIGRITTTGTVTVYTDPSISLPIGITVGGDGALWFANLSGFIGRITTAGVVTSYNADVNGPGGIATGPGGALWYTSGILGTPAITRMTTTGIVTNVQTDPALALPGAIAAGRDGGMWFTDQNSSLIGRIPVAELVVPSGASVVEGNSGTTNLQVPVTLNKPSTQTITAHWTTEFVPGAPAGQADPATDYTPASGTVTFAPGQISNTVTISVNGDTLVEPDEYIVISFSNPTNAKMGGFWGLGFGVILNDD